MKKKKKTKKQKPNYPVSIFVCPAHIRTSKLFCNGQYKIGDDKNTLDLTSLRKFSMLQKGDGMGMDIACPTVYNYKHILFDTYI